MNVQYRTTKLKRLCESYTLARTIVAKRLMAAVALLHSGISLEEISRLEAWRLHTLIGDRKGLLAMDLGRRAAPCPSPIF